MLVGDVGRIDGQLGLVPAHPEAAVHESVAGAGERISQGGGVRFAAPGVANARGDEPHIRVRQRLCECRAEIFRRLRYLREPRADRGENIHTLLRDPGIDITDAGAQLEIVPRPAGQFELPAARARGPFVRGDAKEADGQGEALLNIRPVHLEKSAGQHQSAVLELRLAADFVVPDRIGAVLGRLSRLQPEFAQQPAVAQWRLTHAARAKTLGG